MVGCESSNSSTRSQTQTSLVPASRLTIATRVGSESALNRPARASAASGSIRFAPGAQHAFSNGKLCIDSLQSSTLSLSGGLAEHAELRRVRYAAAAEIAYRSPRPALLRRPSLRVRLETVPRDGRFRR